ncbi:hypothetical protein ACFLZM_07045 [Thermodesulfobacteriota bacterium]
MKKTVICLIIVFVGLFMSNPLLAEAQTEIYAEMERLFISGKQDYDSSKYSEALAKWKKGL